MQIINKIYLWPWFLQGQSTLNVIVFIHVLQSPYNQDLLTSKVGSLFMVTLQTTTV